MVNTVTTLGRSGLQDWLIQRVTAVIMAIYFVGILVYVGISDDFSREAWVKLFDCNFIRYASLITLISLIAHAWIGIWTVTTDYVKPLCIRLPVQLFVIISLLFDLIWGIKVLWGIS